MRDLTLPSLGEGILKATVSFWYFKEGDDVKEGEDIVELATDKATFNLASPCQGRLAKITVNEGGSVKTGDLLARIED